MALMPRWAWLSPAGASGVMAGESGGLWWRLLSVDRALPGVASPSVLGECGHQHDDGLVVQSPGGEAPVVEGAFELRVERFGVGAHAVHAVVVGIGRRQDPQVVAAVELCASSVWVGVSGSHQSCTVSLERQVRVCRA